MLRLILDESEKRIAMALARARYANSRKKKLKTTDLPKASVLDPDIEGVMSELALCKYFGVYPELVFEIGVRSVNNGTDRGDIVFDSLCIDVKSTKHNNGRLFSMKEHEAVDLYVLLIGKRGDYRVAGCMYASELYTKERWGYHGVFKKPCYAAEQHELIPFEKVFPTLLKQPC